MAMVSSYRAVQLSKYMSASAPIFPALDEEPLPHKSDEKEAAVTAVAAPPPIDRFRLPTRSNSGRKMVWKKSEDYVARVCYFKPDNYYRSPRIEKGDDLIFPSLATSRVRLRGLEERWCYISEQAGSHQQQLSAVLDMSDRKELTPQVLRYGVLPGMAKKIRLLRLGLSPQEVLERRKLRKWLDVISITFPCLEHLYLLRTDEEEENDTCEGGDDDENADQEAPAGAQASLTDEETKSIRLQVLYRMPYLASIDGEEISKFERGSVGKTKLSALVERYRSLERSGHHYAVMFDRSQQSSGLFLLLNTDRFAKVEDIVEELKDRAMTSFPPGEPRRALIMRTYHHLHSGNFGKTSESISVSAVAAEDDDESFDVSTNKNKDNSDFIVRVFHANAYKDDWTTLNIFSRRRVKTALDDSTESDTSSLDNDDSSDDIVGTDQFEIGEEFSRTHAMPNPLLEKGMIKERPQPRPQSELHGASERPWAMDYEGNDSQSSLRRRNSFG